MSRDAASVKAAAAGRWLFIHEDLAPALHPAIARKGRHVACPRHGGTDGFRLFKDADQTGGGICNTCGSFADGFALLAWVNGWDFPTTLRAVADDLGLAAGNGYAPAAGSPPEDARARLTRLLGETTPDEERLARYLRHRGLSGLVPDALRFHRALPYYDGNRQHLGDYPAMVARVQRLDGETIALHRTYLAPDGDGKAALDPAKKLTPAVREGATRGAAIRLAPAGPSLHVGEGIETMLGVMQATGDPAWAAGNVGALEALELPAEVRRVGIWADHDASGRGQQAAETAATRFLAEGREVFVLVPPTPDTDWLDVLVTEGAAALRQAQAAARRWAPAPAPNTPRLAWETAAELADATPEVTPWRVKPYLVDEGILEVDGPMKIAGKTTFCLALVGAVLEGAPFLGEPTVKSAVVYLTEQPRTSFRAALRRAGLLGRTDLHILRWGAASGATWPEIVADAVRKAQAVGAKVLVVDTLGQWAGLDGDKENTAGEALTAMAPLQHAAATGLAVLIVRHEKKSGGEVGQAARGSSAFGGIADVIVSLRRAEGRQAPNVRVLHALSRFDETPAQLVVEWTGTGYVALGTETNVATQQARAALVEEAPDDPEHALSVDDILRRRPGVSKPTVKREARRLVEAGTLATVGGGRRGDPLRYFRPPAQEA